MPKQGRMSLSSLHSILISVSLNDTCRRLSYPGVSPKAPALISRLVWVSLRGTRVHSGGNRQGRFPVSRLPT